MHKIKYIIAFLIIFGPVVFIGIDSNALDINSIVLIIEEKSQETDVEEIDFVRMEDIGIMKASWYGPKFHGKYTANKEVYDQMALTAAHKTLPFGTMLRITNLKNEKSVIVRINDRGPYITGRDIDLSKAAALEIDAVEDGVVKVQVEKISVIEKYDPFAVLN